MKDFAGDRSVHVFIGVSAFFLATGCAELAVLAGRPHEIPEVTLDISRNGPDSPLEGSWRSENGPLREGERIQLTLRKVEPGRQEVHSMSAHDLRMDRSEEGWVLNRPAGRLILRSREDDTDAGTFILVPDDVFLTLIRQSDARGLSAWQWMQMVGSGIPPEYAIEVREHSPEMSWHDLLRLYGSGVDLALVAAVRAPSPPRPEPVEAEPPAPRPIHYSVDDMVTLQFRGVDATYITTLRDAGYRLTADEMATMRFRGVPADYAARLRAVGYRLGSDELCRLKFRGVKAEFMEKLWAGGYRFPVDELVTLSFRGVPAEYAVSLADPGYATLPADEIIQLHFRGVDPELVRSLRPPEP